VGVSFGLSLRSVGEVVTDDYVLTGSDPSSPVPAQPTGCSAGYAALTFDDGPVVETTGLLGALRAKGARATFFVIGQQVAGRRAVVGQEAAEGHLVANDAIVGAGVARPKLFRPPYGATNARVDAVGASLGLSRVLWSIDTNDWTGIPVEETVRRVLDPLRAGSIVLFHDRMVNSTAAVPAIVDGMRKRGVCPGLLAPSSVLNPTTASFATVIPA
jgi:peptidoglycan/xylan/chitin deacetylase (PgdA/CDA1 family)